MVLLRAAPGFSLTLALLVLALSLSSVATAGETWDGGGGDSEWSTAANWNTFRGDVAPPPNDGSADIVMAGTTKLSNQVDVDWDVNSLTFNNTAGAFSVNGFPGVTLGVGAGGISNNDTQLQTLLLPIGLNTSQTWTAAAGPILLASGIRSHVLLPRTLTLAGGFDTTVAGPIINQLTLNKTGAGTLFLPGPEGNTYAGNTNVTGGTLALSRTGGTDRAIPGNLTIGDGVGVDVVRLDAAEQIASAVGKLVTINSAGVLNLNGFNETLQNLSFNGGTVSGGTLTVNGTITTGASTTSVISSNVIGELTINGAGTLMLSGSTSTTTGILGASGAGDGVVTVGGAGSTWSNSGSIYVGGSALIDGGNGTLSITNEGLVDVGGTLKLWPGGTLALNGGTLVTANLQLAGGAFNWISGTLHFVSHLSVEPLGPLGDSVAVEAGRSLVTDGNLVVGNAGSGTLIITGGGGAYGATGGGIGTQVGSTGVVTIEGNISNWSTSGDLHIGNAGDGTLNVSNGGRVLVHDADAFIGDGGSVVLDDGSWRIQGEQCTFCAAGGTLTIFGGNLEIKGGGLVHNESESFVRQGGTVKVSGVGSTWEFDDRLAISSSQVLISNGGVVLGGTGDSDVSIGGEGFVTVDGIGSKMDLASSSHLNDLFVGVLSSSGSLAVTNGGLVEAGNVIVSPMSEIQGNGSIMGHVQNGGLVSPGTSPGALSIEGDYTQTADGELLIELGPLNYDQLLINDQTTLGGTLIVNLLDNFIPGAGQTFTIITADDIDGTFATELFPSVPGLIFDVIYNPQSVVLAVLPAFTADFDKDGDVESDDLAQWQGDFGFNALSDADNDGDSDGDDFLQWQRQLGSPAPATPNTGAAPEPGSVSLAMIALGAFLAARRPARERKI